MYGFRRFSSYKKTVVAVKLLKKLVQKVGGMGVLEHNIQNVKCKILNTLYTQCVILLGMFNFPNVVLLHSTSD